MSLIFDKNEKMYNTSQIFQIVVYILENITERQNGIYVSCFKLLFQENKKYAYKYFKYRKKTSCMY